MSDPVNHPAHYNQGSVECIDAIRSALGDAFPDYCVGNAMKYEYRWRHKGGVEDLKKAIVYLKWAVEAMESNTSKTPDSCCSSKPGHLFTPENCEAKFELGDRVILKGPDGGKVGVIIGRGLEYGTWRYSLDSVPNLEFFECHLEPANTSKTSKSCDPREKQYRDVTTADVGKMIEVKDRTEDNWRSRKLLDFAFGGIYCESPEGSRLPWKFARIEVTE